MKIARCQLWSDGTVTAFPSSIDDCAILAFARANGLVPIGPCYEDEVDEKSVALMEAGLCDNITFTLSYYGERELKELRDRHLRPTLPRSRELVEQAAREGSVLISA